MSNLKFVHTAHHDQQDPMPFACNDGINLMVKVFLIS